MLFEGDNGVATRACGSASILNVNLAILNMLPIPVLDGGHIVLALIESVRRKPVNMRVLEVIQTGCATFIIGYIALHQLFRSRRFAWINKREARRGTDAHSCASALARAVIIAHRRAKFILASMSASYCENPFSYRRRISREVMIGNVGVGGANPIRVQSMITCDTMDTEASIAETMELAQAGCEIVRITAPTVKDAANLQHIVRGLA